MTPMSEPVWTVVGAPTPNRCARCGDHFEPTPKDRAVFDQRVGEGVRGDATVRIEVCGTCADESARTNNPFGL